MRTDVHYQQVRSVPGINSIIVMRQWSSWDPPYQILLLVGTRYFLYVIAYITKTKDHQVLPSACKIICLLDRMRSSLGLIVHTCILA